MIKIMERIAKLLFVITINTGEFYSEFVERENDLGEPEIALELIFPSPSSRGGNLERKVSGNSLFSRYPQIFIQTFIP